MITWHPRIIRIAIAVGAFVAFAIASGAGARWT